MHAATGDIRFTPGSGGISEDGNAQFGGVEIFSGGGWGLVCHDGTLPDTRESAPVSLTTVGIACKQLGFQAGEKYDVVRIAAVRSTSAVRYVWHVHLQHRCACACRALQLLQVEAAVS